MKQKILFLSGILISFNTLIVGQAPQLVKITPPSPNVQAMQKYGDVPVNMYTGVPNISIPIYTAKFRDIAIPISISYHSSGIKVAEDASQVGLGWNLNAGGVISRNIIGIDDFLGSAYFNGTGNTIMNFSDGQGPLNPLQKGCVYQMFNRSVPNSPTLYSLDLTSYLDGSPAYDFQPDQYYFNFLDQSGKFIVKRNKVAVLEKQERLEITIISSNVWQIKSVDGFIYDFTEYETCSDVGTPGVAPSTAWYLTKITSPLGNIVTLNYTKNNINITTIGSYSETTDAAELPTIYNNDVFYSHNTGTQKGIAPAKIYSHIALSSIDFT